MSPVKIFPYETSKNMPRITLTTKNSFMFFVIYLNVIAIYLNLNVFGRHNEQQSKVQEISNLMFAHCFDRASFWKLPQNTGTNFVQLECLQIWRETLSSEGSKTLQIWKKFRWLEAVQSQKCLKVYLLADDIRTSHILYNKPISFSDIKIIFPTEWNNSFIAHKHF